MEKTKITRCELSETEIAEIVKKHLGVPEDSDVYFEVKGEEDSGDWRAEYPLTYVFKGATITVTDRENK